MIKFRGLIAPTEVPTGDGRMFAAGKMTHRPLPIPLLARFGSGGHEGAVPVGTIDRIYDGPGGYWCEGSFLDPAMVSEVPKAVYLLKKKVMGPSVDLDRDFTVEAIAHPTRPDKKAGMFKEYNVIGITLVPMPAFHQVHMSVDDEPFPASLLASALIDTADWEIEGAAEFDVNGESWRSWPVAPRDYTFDADDAVKRIAYWAGIGSKAPSIDRYASTFLWRNGSETGDTLAQDSFRLPLADIINGEPYLIYHAVYSAAALLSGAHGGLPQVPETDKALMIRVINEIYANLAGVFQDPNLKSPFLVGVRPEEMVINSESGLDTSDCGCENGVVPDNVNFEGNVPETGAEPMSQSITLQANGQSYTFGTEASVSTVTVTFTPANLPLDVLKSIQEQKRPYDDSGCHFNEDGFCMDHYGIQQYGELKPYGDVPYADPGYQEDKQHRYPIDRESHIRAAWSYINMAKNAAKYKLEQLNMIKERIKAAAKEHGIEISSDKSEEMSVGAPDQDVTALLAGAAPLAPPATWFQNPALQGPTRLTVTDDGHVFGHLAQWRVCHVGIGNSCVIAPHTRQDYNLFKVGTLVCDDGSKVPVGKITLGTGHANAQWGVMPSREHYDNTGWAAAVVTVGEDYHGIWVNGALTASMTPARVVELRAAALSGDWREVNGNLELIAALAVNNPGFPIYREANGRAFSLTAVGVLGAEDDLNVSGEFSMGEEEIEATETVEVVGPDQEALFSRLQEIDEELAAHQRGKRLAQLAVLDDERDQVVAPKATARSNYFRVSDARFEQVSEEDEED